MQDAHGDSSEVEEAEMEADLERYFRLIIASRSAWWDFWLLGVLTIFGGLGVFFFSGETWAPLVATFTFVLLLIRTSRMIGRFDGELSYLHRKWIRRGHFFITDGKSAEALPHQLN